jgi:phosphatidylinositol alpha-1,6-mannosyltransferase
MKSLLISGVYFPPQVGGISRMMERFAFALGGKRLCCLTGAAGDPGRVGGARVYRSPTLFSDRPKFLRAVAWGRNLGAILLAERPRTVLLATVEDGPYGLWIRRWLGIPYVVFAHGNEICRILSTPAAHELQLRVLASAARVVAVSDFTARLVERTGVPADRIDVVYPGCDVDLLVPQPASPELRSRLLGSRAGNRVLLSLGNLVGRKGHDMVIRALSQVRQTVPDVTYLIVGDGPYRGELERLAEALAVSDHVVFAGRANDAELPSIYALADVFVMPSRERREENDVEGFGLVYLEAGACGKPVIGGRSGGVPEAIQDGVTGLLVDPQDPEDIARAITRILTEPGLATALGTAGAARVRSGFTWSQAAERMHSVLAAVANGQAQPAPRPASDMA